MDKTLEAMDFANTLQEANLLSGAKAQAQVNHDNNASVGKGAQELINKIQKIANGAEEFTAENIKEYKDAINNINEVDNNTKKQINNILNMTAKKLSQQTQQNDTQNVNSGTQPATDQNAGTGNATQGGNTDSNAAAAQNGENPVGATGAVQKVENTISNKALDTAIQNLKPFSNNSKIKAVLDEWEKFKATLQQAQQ